MPTAPMAPTWKPLGATIEECLEEAQSMQEVEEDIPASYFGLVDLFREICD